MVECALARGRVESCVTPRGKEKKEQQRGSSSSVVCEEIWSVLKDGIGNHRRVPAHPDAISHLSEL